MTIDYTQIASDALTSITNAGTSVNIKRIVEGGFDDATGNTLPGSEVTATGFGVLTAYKTMDVDGTVIKQGDMKLLLAAYELSIEPTATDIITIGSTDWTVVSVDIVEPDGAIPVLYKCQVRK